MDDQVLLLLPFLHLMLFWFSVILNPFQFDLKAQNQMLKFVIVITLLCIAFTMFLAECKSAYSFSLKSIFDQKSSTEDKEDGNKTFSLDSAYQDSSARIAGFNELFDNRPEAERFYFCSGFNSAEIEGFSNTVNINQNLANRVSVSICQMQIGKVLSVGI